MMCNQSSDQDSSLEDEKAKKEDRPSSKLGDDDLFKTRQVHYSSKWKTRQDAVYWIYLARAQRQRTTVLANQISCRNCMQLCAIRLHLQSDFSKKERTFFERLSTRRPSPKIVLKSAWQSQQQQQQQQQDTSESSASGNTKETGTKRGPRYPTDNPETRSVRKLMRSTEFPVEKSLNF